LRYQAREAAFEAARLLRTEGRLPIALERKIGPTLDWTPFAPSEGARKAGRPVARVVMLGGPGTQPEGFATSFLISSRLLMTNHHVFPTRADAAGTGANFLFEQNERGVGTGTIFEIDANAFYATDEQLDFAIVAVKPRSLNGMQLVDFGCIPLIEATSKILIGQPINIIQHPEGGQKQYAIKENRLVDLLDGGFLHYETDTLRGSSGSPAFSANWQLVGLHHASIPEMVGDKIVTIGGGTWDDSMPDDSIHWIANEGARVSAVVKRLGEMRMEDSDKQALLNDVLSNTTDPADEITSEMARPSARPTARVIGGGGGNNQFNISGPVTIHIYAPKTDGESTPAQVAAPAEAAKVVAVEKVIRFDSNYRSREGYDPKFLNPDDPNFAVPTPTVSEERQRELLKDKSGKPRVLKYHHFELVMNEDRYLQMWSAVNVDYNPELKAKGDRKSFGSDKWIPDPRIPGEIQIQDPEFYKPAGNIDRGHIVRREDNAWGANDEEIEFANSDTFHWTNCTPQHEAFNQSTPGKNDPTYKGMKGLWGDFENYVQKSLNGEDARACILAGPVLSGKDPSKDFGYGPVKYPLQFWKVIAVPVSTDGEARLTVYGFILSQQDVVNRFGIETFRAGPFRKYQASLAAITRVTGVIFHDKLHKADVLSGRDDRVLMDDNSHAAGLQESLPRTSSTEAGAIKVVADGVNSSPGQIKKDKLLSENGYRTERDRRRLAQEINLHFWHDRGQAFFPWLNPADTAIDQTVMQVVVNVDRRHPHARTSSDRPPPGV
jgi:endonuclease G